MAIDVELIRRRFRWTSTTEWLRPESSMRTRAMRSVGEMLG